MPPILSSGSLTSTCASSIASTVTNALCDFSSDVKRPPRRTATVMFASSARRSVSAEPPPSAGGRRPGLVDRFGIEAEAAEPRPEPRGAGGL